MKNRPKRCCHPDCQNCPYADCRWDTLTTLDYTETNNRDYFLFEDSTGRKYHKGSDENYRNGRQTAYQREHRKYQYTAEYMKRYYAEHRDEILRRQKENYNTEKNTRKCRKYRKSHLDNRKNYEKAYYEENKEKIKERARERYYEKRKSEKDGVNMEIS